MTAQEIKPMFDQFLLVRLLTAAGDVLLLHGVLGHLPVGLCLLRLLLLGLLLGLGVGGAVPVGDGDLLLVGGVVLGQRDALRRGEEVVLGAGAPVAEALVAPASVGKNLHRTNV